MLHFFKSSLWHLPSRRSSCRLWPDLLWHSKHTQELAGSAVQGRGSQGTPAGLCPALPILAGDPGPSPARPAEPPWPFPVPHLLDALHQRVLVEGHGLGALVQVVLVPQAQLQHLLRVQLLQLGVGRGRLPAEETYNKAKEGPELIWLFVQIVQP